MAGAGKATSSLQRAGKSYLCLLQGLLHLTGFAESTGDGLLLALQLAQHVLQPLQGVHVLLARLTFCLWHHQKE